MKNSKVKLGREVNPPRDNGHKGFVRIHSVDYEKGSVPVVIRVRREEFLQFLKTVSFE